MEEITDFDKLLQEYLNKEIIYYAQFNVESGRVNKLGPKDSFNHEDKNLIEVDKETAQLVLSGEVPLGSCFVDTIKQTFEIIETKHINKIDDVLHRIIDVNWTDIDHPDVYITCKNNKIIVELSEDLGGTFKHLNPDEITNLRKIFWSNDTMMSFLLTDYNDPHVVHKELKCKLYDLLEGPVEFDNIEYNNKYSLYTRRLFKNYILEAE